MSGAACRRREDPPVRREDGTVPADGRYTPGTARSSSPDRASLILLSCAAALKPLERMRLLLRVPSYRELSRLSQVDVELTIGRRLRRAMWRPGAYERIVDRTLAWAAVEGNSILWPGDPRYPTLLREIYDPPAVLFVRGNADFAGKPAISVVGTRRPDDGALKAAYHLGREAANAGIAVVSGLALGIDAAAHRGVVSAGGTAVAVLGSGIDTIYPQRHRELGAEILRNGGTAVSEYPPGTPVRKYQFPARNRIITGCSSTLLVIQAPEGSGALISVDYALDQGRDVWVHETGLCTGSAAAGTRRVHEDGAPVFTTIADIVGDTGAGFSPGSRPVKTSVRDPRLALFGPDPGTASSHCARDVMLEFVNASIQEERE